MTKEHFNEIVNDGDVWTDFKTDEEVIDFLNGLDFFDFECEWIENNGYNNSVRDLISVLVCSNMDNSYDINVFVSGNCDGWDGEWKYFKTITYSELENLINK